MRITVSLPALIKALTFAKLALPRRPVIPVLAGVKLTVTGTGLTVAAFDYDTSARVTVPMADGTASVAGEILVNGASLADAVKALPKGKGNAAKLATVELDTAAEFTDSTQPDGAVTVTGQGISMTVPGLPLADYPALPYLPPVAGTFAGEALTRSVTRVAAAAGTDDTLPSLLCVQFETGPDEVTMAATDRYRLAVDVAAWTPARYDAPGMPAKVLIHARTLTGYLKHLATDGKIALHLADGVAGLSDGTREVTMRTTAGEFPNYRQLLRPASADNATVITDGAAFAAAVARAGKLTGRNQGIDLATLPAGLTVHGRNEDGERASSETVTGERHGNAFAARFNPDYLGSLLTGISGLASLGFVTMPSDQPGELARVGKPAMITPADSSDPFQALIMPIRIGG